MEAEKARALSPIEWEYLRLRGMGPHDRLQQMCWLPGHPEVGKPMDPRAAVGWCLANPLPRPVMGAMELVVRGDSAMAAAESRAEQREEVRVLVVAPSHQIEHALEDGVKWPASVMVVEPFAAVLGHLVEPFAAVLGHRFERAILLAVNEPSDLQRWAREMVGARLVSGHLEWRQGVTLGDVLAELEGGR